MKKMICLLTAGAMLSLAACKGNHDYKTSGRDSNGTTTSKNASGATMQGGGNSAGTPADTSGLGRTNQPDNGQTQDPTHH